MADESDNDEVSTLAQADGHMEIEVEVLPDRASPPPDGSSKPPSHRSRPPPKPKSRPSMPSAPSVRRSSIPMPRPSIPPAEPPVAKVTSPSSVDRVTPSSIKPMRMIALGEQRKRSEPPPSAVERTSFRPAPPDGLAPQIDTRAQVAELRAP